MGSTPRADVRDADEWWDSEPDQRRVQIWRWVTQPSSRGQAPGQLDLLDHPAATTTEPVRT